MESLSNDPDRLAHGERDQRRDFATARTVDQTLGVQVCYGTYCAAVLLRNKGFSIGVALRVLTRPAQLRTPLPPNLLEPRLYGSVQCVAYRHTYR